MKPAQVYDFGTEKYYINSNLYFSLQKYSAPSKG